MRSKAEMAPRLFFCSNRRITLVPSLSKRNWRIARAAAGFIWSVSGTTRCRSTSASEGIVEVTIVSLYVKDFERGRTRGGKALQTGVGPQIGCALPHRSRDGQVSEHCRQLIEPDTA